MRRGENASEAGKALVAKRGPDYMREIAARGGKRGGRALVKSRGKRYMRKIGGHGPEHRSYETGWRHSEETRAKMSAGQRRRREREARGKRIRQEAALVSSRAKRRAA